MSPFWKRTISGIIYCALVVAGLLIHPAIYMFLMCVAVYIMTREYYNMALGEELAFQQSLGTIISVIAYYITSKCISHSFPPMFFLFDVLGIIVLWITILFTVDREHFGKSLFLFVPLFYVTLPFALFSYFVFIRGVFSGLLLLSMFIILWASDVGAYVFGMSFGQKNGHKLCPSISPKKSWEGVFGGLFTALVASCALYCLGMFRFELWNVFVITILLNATSVLGDLVESQHKRYFDFKDSGTILPGHGGLLDRFDGAIIALPVVLFYLKIFGFL